MSIKKMTISITIAKINCNIIYNNQWQCQKSMAISNTWKLPLSFLIILNYALIIIFTLQLLFDIAISIDIVIDF